MKKIILLLSVLLFSAAITAYWMWTDYQKFLTAKRLLKTESVFIIERGESFNHLVKRLTDKKIIDKSIYLKIYAKLEKFVPDLKSGEYELPSTYTVKELMQLFISGKVKQYQLTLVEGWSLKQIINYLNQIESLKSFKHEASFFKNLGIKQDNPEGYFYPDTYFYTRGTSSSEILKRSYQKMQYILLQEWQNRNQTIKNYPLKTPYQALILASIIEKETGKGGERDKVAGVFVKRLQIKMKLQSDPTIIYGMGDRYKGNIRKKDILAYSDYNTYQINDLPPTPIASPGRASIHAVMHPDISGDLYFVADGKGGHVFSKTLSEHNTAVNNYLKILKKQ